MWPSSPAWSVQASWFSSGIILEHVSGSRKNPSLMRVDGGSEQEMLEWTAAGSGTRFMALVHHHGTEREWAYDRKSNVGRLDKAWDEAMAKGWIVVSMKDDWKTILPPGAM